MRNFTILIFICLLFFSATESNADGIYKKNKRTIVIPAQSSPRVKFGADKLAKSLSLIGYDVKIVQKDKLPKSNELIIIGTKGDQLLADLSAGGGNSGQQPGKEGFSIAYAKNKNLVITGQIIRVLYTAVWNLLMKLKKRVSFRRRSP